MYIAHNDTKQRMNEFLFGVLPNACGMQNAIVLKSWSTQNNSLYPIRLNV